MMVKEASVPRAAAAETLIRRDSCDAIKVKTSQNSLLTSGTNVIKLFYGAETFRNFVINKLHVHEAHEVSEVNGVPSVPGVTEVHELLLIIIINRCIVDSKASSGENNVHKNARHNH